MNSTEIVDKLSKIDFTDVNIGVYLLLLGLSCAFYLVLRYRPYFYSDEKRWLIAIAIAICFRLVPVYETIYLPVYKQILTVVMVPVTCQIITTVSLLLSLMLGVRAVTTILVPVLVRQRVLSFQPIKIYKEVWVERHVSVPVRVRARVYA